MGGKSVRVFAHVQLANMGGGGYVKPEKLQSEA